MKSEQFKDLETTITVDRGELENSAGCSRSLTVAHVDVVDDDQVSRFFISVNINSQGRAVATVSVNKPHSGSSSKSVVGYKKEIPQRASL